MGNRVQIKIAHCISPSCWREEAGCKDPARDGGITTHSQNTLKVEEVAAQDHFVLVLLRADNELETSLKPSDPLYDLIQGRFGPSQITRGCILITPHQSISISIVSVKGFRPRAMHRGASRWRDCPALKWIRVEARGHYFDVMWERIIWGHWGKEALIFLYIKVASFFFLCRCVGTSRERRGAVYKAGMN